MPTESTSDAASVDLDEIRRVLADEPVTLAVLYGSRARGEAATGSDVDLAVAFRRELASVDRTRARLSLIERLGEVLDTHVDVVPLDRTAGALLDDILRDGVVVYGDESALDRYRSKGDADEDPSERFDEVLADIEALL